MKHNTPPSFTKAPSWVDWIAQDPDGSWWGFEAHPMIADYGWYENETGRYVRLGDGLANPQWRDSLRRRQDS